MNKYIPYGHQSIDEYDIKAVVDVLKSDWLTTGPSVENFEKKVSKFCGCKYAVSVSSGTAALHTAMYAIGISDGDEVIVPSITFAASANSVVFQGGIPIFCDVEEDTLLIDCDLIENLITNKTRAIIAVDYAGQPCDYDRLREIASKHNLILIADACHSLGASYYGKRVGSNLADITVFSFHPVKNITTGEGGMVVTNSKEYYERSVVFRNHCVDVDYKQRMKKGDWFYDITDLGYNYRMTDMQCALGISQISKLPNWLLDRHAIANIYDMYFKDMCLINPLKVNPGIFHAYHLYVVKFCDQKVRDRMFSYLRNCRIGVNVHYIPVHLHSFYKNRFKTHEGLCSISESVYHRILSLPIFPSMTICDVNRVIDLIDHNMKTLQ